MDPDRLCRSSSAPERACLPYTLQWVVYSRCGEGIHGLCLPAERKGGEQGMRSAQAALADLWGLTGLSDEPLQTVDLPGHDPVLPSSFRVGTAAQVSIAAVACA